MTPEQEKFLETVGRQIRDMLGLDFGKVEFNYCNGKIGVINVTESHKPQSA